MSTAPDWIIITAREHGTPAFRVLLQPRQWPGVYTLAQQCYILGTNANVWLCTHVHGALS
jgi:hypothetical protein